MDERSDANHVALALGGQSAQNLVIFDGACGFCAWSLTQFIRRFQPRGVVCVPYQWMPAEILARLGTDERRCANALHLWNAGDGRLYAGADAFNRLAADTRLARPAIKILEAWGPFVRAERIVYAFVARHRTGISAWLGTRRYAVIGAADAPRRDAKP